MIFEEETALAEHRYLKVIEDFFIRNRGDTYLPSHDIDHHRWVWHYS